MEIAGFFDGVGRPRVEARVGFTGLNLGGEIRFVVDTGADTTLIGYDDAIRLGVHYGHYRPEDSVRTLGIAGSLRTYDEEGWLVLRSVDDGEHTFGVALSVAEENPDGWVPSLLGRDILDRFDLFVSRRRNVLTLTRPLDWP